MRVDVVNVGDGACTVVRQYDEAMVMDCGSWRAPTGEGPAALLRATLGATAPIPSTVVVTHFDSDHWMGLKAFADSSQVGGGDVQLFYPRFPGRTGRNQAALLAYQSLSGRLAAPERSAIDLINAWRSKSRRFTAAALSEGDTFHAVSTKWRVLWPPMSLGASTSRAFNRIAEESEELARNYGPLANALQRVYASGVVAMNDEESIVEDDAETGADGEPPSVDHDQLDGYGVDDFADAPIQLRDRLRRNRREVQAINNELSLVVEEDHGRLLNFGDLQTWGLNELLRRDSLRSCYDTMLAPHHGTQFAGKRMSTAFPSSTQIIAQNGESHLPRLKAEALSARTWRLISTAREGTAVVYPRCHCSVHWLRDAVI